MCYLIYSFKEIYAMQICINALKIVLLDLSAIKLFARDLEVQMVFISNLLQSTFLMPFIVLNT